MNAMPELNQTPGGFGLEDCGAQVVEYALVIALVSIGLAVALSTAFGSGATSAFADLVTRVKSCFAAGATTC